MSLDYPRVVLGYPIPKILNAAASLALNASMVATLVGGPGELLGFEVWCQAGGSVRYLHMECTITVDGVVYYTGVLRDLILMNTQYAGHGLFGTCDVQPPDSGVMSFACRIPYLVSCSVTIKHKHATATWFVYEVFYRIGE